MQVRITETVGQNKNPDVKKWHETKVKELAHLLVNKAKEQTIYVKEPISEHKELEVMIR